MNDNNKQNNSKNIHNNVRNSNSSEINKTIKINNENKKEYNKVIKALFDNDYANDNNEQKEKFTENFYKYNFEKSKNIDSLNNILLIKNSIGQEIIEPMNKFQNRIKNNGGNKIFKNKIDNDLIESKEEEKEKENEKAEKVEIRNNENNKKEVKGELDLTYNFDNDIFNITQQQMDIMDGEVNKIYNKHKNKIEDKIFKMKYPFLKDKNLYSESNNITKEERQKRLSPIIEKQKLILEKIKKDNILRSNISSSNNNDSDNKTKMKIIKSNKIFYPYKMNYLNNNSNGNIYYNQDQRNNNLKALFPSYNQNSIQFNNDFNKNIILSNFHNNNIQRYQNLYNIGQLSSENNSIDSSNDKINLNKSNQRKIIYEPYTLNDYKRKYEKMNKKRKLFGGLGANIGDEEWINRQKKLERKKQYSDYVKSDNEEDFKKQKKIKLKLKNENNEITKTISSKKSYEFSNGRFTEPTNKKYYNIQTETNIKKIKLPLIKDRFNNKNNIKKAFNKSNSNKKYKIKDNFESDKLNPLYQINGDEKDLKELIKQYEEYNGKF